MNIIMTEKEYQKHLLDFLVNNQGYTRRSNSNFERRFAVDSGMLFGFLGATQPEAMQELTKIYKDDTHEVILTAINTAITQKGGSLLHVLKHGVEVHNQPLTLMYQRPATSFNPELSALYDQNTLSVAEEVWVSDKERVDIIIFMNGLAIMSFELKANPSGQSVEDAIEQYRTQRNSETRAFKFKIGVLVNFAMDLQEVHMSTRLTGEDTFFLPFNMGNGQGVEAGKGNPISDDELPVSYMWNDVLKKDSIVELISKFIFIEVKEDRDEITGKKKIKETLIFPRFHQRRCVRRILDDVHKNGSNRSYLIQHSAGSGKTNSIAWLAHRLSTHHNEKDEVIFNNVIIVTDRVVVDRQLQKAVMGLEHKSGLIRAMDDKSTSSDLKNALESNTKIIATTIQKFPYIVDQVRNLSHKRFAVIIDEAHSSTAGKSMSAITKSLGSIDEEESTAEDLIVSEISRNGKQPNVSFFAFTATPKASTLALFGQQNIKGMKEPFDIYSMKQAIEEGFILDVLSNYTTYDTFYRLNKAIEEDPELNTSSAKGQIARFLALHDTNITQRIEIIIEHFRTTVAEQLGGTAKAMVVTGSREEAAKYRLAFDSYIKRKGYKDIKALVAFTNKVTLEDENGQKNEYTEPGMNGFSEARLPEEFEKNEYRVLLVAGKYQTGFDQSKLCAMYVLKSLKSVNAVQTLSRLNRICPPFDKSTFVLDFKNSYEDMKKAFGKYYTTTMLSNTVTPHGIYEIEAKIDGYLVFDLDDIERANAIIYENKTDQKTRNKLLTFFMRAKKRIDQLDEDDQRELIVTMRHFIKFYEFLIQATAFEDTELHRKYNFYQYMASYLSIRRSGAGFNLKGKIEATNFVQKESGSHKKPKIASDPALKLATADQYGVTEIQEKRLSEIIEEINSRTGRQFDADIVIKSVFQIRDLLMKSGGLRVSAKNNTEQDFQFKFYDEIDSALLAGLDQNQEFYSLLLSDREITQQLMGLFSEEIYKALRKNID